MASFPSDYMVQAVEMDTVVVQLDGSCSACTYCYCILEEPGEGLADIDLVAHQRHIALVQPNEPAQNELGLGRPVLFACSKPQPAVVAACLEQVSG